MGKASDKRRRCHRTLRPGDQNGSFVVTGSKSADVYLLEVDPEGVVRWERTFGGEDYDIGRSVQETTDGGYIIAGSTASMGAGGRDVYLLKTDLEGNPLWEQSFGGEGRDEGYSGQPTGDGGYVVVGSTSSFGAGGVYLLKINSAGDLEWQQSYASERGGGVGFSVQQTNDGGFFIVGGSTNVLCNTFPPNNFCGGICLFRTDSGGNLLWQKVVEGLVGYSIQRSVDGQYIITGSATGEDVYLLKSDDEGNILWEATFENGSGGCSVYPTADGGYVVAGWTESIDECADENEVDVYLLRTDKDGNPLWERDFGHDRYEGDDCDSIDRDNEPSSVDDWALSVREVTAGGYIVVGGSTTKSLYLIRTDSDGERLWQRIVGGALADGGYSVQQARDGGYLVTGASGCDSVGVEDYELHYCGPVYLARTDPEGGLLWERTFDLTDDEVGFSQGGYSIEQTADGGYIMAGAGYIVARSPGFLMRLDAEGNRVWQQGVPLEATSVQQTTDGGYIVAGRSHSDLTLVKADQWGFTVWQRSFGGEKYDIGRSVQETTDGGYIIAGSTASMGAGGRDVYLLKTDLEGNLEWQATFGGTQFDEGWSVQANDGGYVVAGSTASFGAGGADIYLLETDLEGGLKWERTYGGADFDRARSLQRTTDGGYVLAGTIQNDIPCVLKTGPDGDPLWEAMLSGRPGHGWCVRQTTNGGYVVAGVSRVLGDLDVYLAKLSPDLVSGDLQNLGDCNQDGVLDISDAICIFSAVLPAQSKAFPCGDGSNVDDANIALIDWQPDGAVDVLDGVGILHHLFLGTPHLRGGECLSIKGCPGVCDQ